MPRGRKPDYRKFYNQLDWPEKRKIEQLQMDLFEQGYAKDTQFVQLECRKKAIDIFKSEIKAE